MWLRQSKQFKYYSILDQYDSDILTCLVTINIVENEASSHVAKAREIQPSRSNDMDNQDVLSLYDLAILGDSVPNGRV